MCQIETLYLQVIVMPCDKNKLVEFGNQVNFIWAFSLLKKKKTMFLDK